MKNMYCCTSFRKYDYLTNLGYEVEYYRKDKNNPKHYVWFFADTPDLRTAVDEYYKNYDTIM